MGDSTTSSQLRILCFGDSLTEGYTCFGTIYTPYSEKFKTELEIQSGTGGNERIVDVITDGQSGDLVTRGISRAGWRSAVGFQELSNRAMEQRSSGTGQALVLVAIFPQVRLREGRGLKVQSRLVQR